MRPTHLLLLLALTATATACCPRLYPTTTTQTKDSVRVEYRERLVRDTAYIEVPREMERVVTRDTTSHLENTYCSSDASVHDGLLRHSLATKPQTIKAPVAVPVHDTLIVHIKSDTIIEEKVVEVAKPLSGWVKFWRNFGYASALALLVWLAFKILRNRTSILALIRKLLSL